MPEIFEDGGMDEYREYAQKKADEMFVDFFAQQEREWVAFVQNAYALGSVYEHWETTDDFRIVYTAYNIQPGEEHLLPKLPENKHYELKPDINGRNRAVIVTDFHVGD